VIGDESLPRDGHVAALTCDPTTRREVARGGVRLAQLGARTQTQGGGDGDRSWSRGQSRRRGRRCISGRWRRRPELGVGCRGERQRPEIEEVGTARRLNDGWRCGGAARRRGPGWRDGAGAAPHRVEVVARRESSLGQRSLRGGARRVGPLRGGRRGSRARPNAQRVAR
jgi:hypothetical protein